MLQPEDRRGRPTKLLKSSRSHTHPLDRSKQSNNHSPLTRPRPVRPGLAQAACRGACQRRVCYVPSIQPAYDPSNARNHLHPALGAVALPDSLYVSMGLTPSPSSDASSLNQTHAAHAAIHRPTPRSMRSYSLASLPSSPLPTLTLTETQAPRPSHSSHFGLFSADFSALRSCCTRSQLAADKGPQISPSTLTSSCPGNDTAPLHPGHSQGTVAQSYTPGLCYITNSRSLVEHTLLRSPQA